MDDTSFGILLPNIRDAFHLSNAGILSVVAVAAVVGLALQVPIAQMADRHNRVRLMLLGATIFAGFVFGTGLAIVGVDARAHAVGGRRSGKPPSARPTTR